MLGGYVSLTELAEVPVPFDSRASASGPRTAYAAANHPLGHANPWDYSSTAAQGISIQQIVDALPAVITFLVGSGGNGIVGNSGGDATMQLPACIPIRKLANRAASRVAQWIGMLARYSRWTVNFTS